MRKHVYTRIESMNFVGLLSWIFIFETLTDKVNLITTGHIFIHLIKLSHIFIHLVLKLKCYPLFYLTTVNILCNTSQPASSKIKTF